MLIALFLDVSACKHSEPYQPKKRAFDPGEYSPQPASGNGSLFAAGRRGLIEDDRPQGVGDVIIVRIDETDSASHDSTTKLDRGTKTSLGISGALEKLDPGLEIGRLFGATTESGMEGGGRIQRRGQLNAILPMRVQKILPNGDFYIEGTKVVLLGEEERHLYVSGVARLADVRSDGSIFSSRIADAAIEYTGSGDASDQQRPGWFSRILMAIWPF